MLFGWFIMHHPHFLRAFRQKIVYIVELHEANRILPLTEMVGALAATEDTLGTDLFRQISAGFDMTTEKVCRAKRNEIMRLRERKARAHGAGLSIYMICINVYRNFPIRMRVRSSPRIC